MNHFGCDEGQSSVTELLKNRATHFRHIMWCHLRLYVGKQDSVPFLPQKNEFSPTLLGKNIEPIRGKTIRIEAVRVANAYLSASGCEKDYTIVDPLLNLIISAPVIHLRVCQHSHLNSKNYIHQLAD